MFAVSHPYCSLDFHSCSVGVEDNKYFFICQVLQVFSLLTLFVFNAVLLTAVLELS